MKLCRGWRCRAAFLAPAGGARPNCACASRCVTTQPTLLSPINRVLRADEGRNEAGLCPRWDSTKRGLPGCGGFAKIVTRLIPLPAVLLLAATVLSVPIGSAARAEGNAPAAPHPGELVLPQLHHFDPIELIAERAVLASSGPPEIWVLEGGVELRQGQHELKADRAVVWATKRAAGDDRPHLLHLYAEGNVTAVATGNNSRAIIRGNTWQYTYESTSGVRIQGVAEGTLGEPQRALLSRARLARDAWIAGKIERASFVDAWPWGSDQQLGPPPQASTPQLPSTPPSGAAGGLGEAILGQQAVVSSGLVRSTAGGIRISVFPRSDIPVQVEWRQEPATGEWVGLITSGVNVLIHGVPGIGVWQPETIDIATDRMVIWVKGLEQPDLSGQRPLPADAAVEVYMEGNIVFREGDRVVYAERMYYDVARRIGVLVDAELLTPVPQYEGLLRVRARALRQLGPDRFRAEHAYVTSSRMGFPTYRLQAGEVVLETSREPVIDPLTGGAPVDPTTGEIQTESHHRLTARDNALYIGPLPVFIWPEITTDLEEPSFYIRRVRVKNDNVFGFQVLTDWDAYQIFGIRSRPKGTRWDISLDLMTDRGLGHGTTFLYRGESFLGIPGPVTGLVDYWGIQDEGFDNLGRGRRRIEPEKDYRWRWLWQHRQLLPGNWQLTAETGWVSDRNFLEQYFEREWDELKDLTTGIELKRLQENRSFAVSADYRINNFFTQTDWLPRLDHYWLGESLFSDRLTWYQHTSVGFARLRTASYPENPIPYYRYRAWETSDGVTPLGTVASERLATRHELDLPLQLGPFRVVPYVLGEAAHWGEDRGGEDAQRLLGQAGIRVSLPLWRVDPTVRSELWNVNGLAHKVTLEAEFLYADSTLDLDRLPLYDPLDDDAVEVFRRRMPPGLSLPQLDERFYAVRYGLGSWVTSPATEIAEDLMVFRVGMRHRWQTKRGPPEAPRIVDWIVLDTRLSLFPKPDRDNFGESVGLVEYDWRWQVGNRLALVSEGIFDFFSEGQRILTAGAILDRPPSGHIYAGVHVLQGAIDSTVFQFSYSYRLSPKWISSFTSAIDFGDGGNIGQSFWLTRVGESLLVSLGANVDSSRGSWGIGFSVEPRFLGRSRLPVPGGVRIPPAGAYGLE